MTKTNAPPSDVAVFGPDFNVPLTKMSVPRPISRANELQTLAGGQIHSDTGRIQRAPDPFRLRGVPKQLGMDSTQPNMNFRQHSLVSLLEGMVKFLKILVTVVLTG